MQHSSTIGPRADARGQVSRTGISFDPNPLCQLNYLHTISPSSSPSLEIATTPAILSLLEAITFSIFPASRNGSHKRAVAADVAESFLADDGIVFVVVKCRAP